MARPVAGQSGEGSLGRFRDGWPSVVATAMLTNPAGVLGAITPAIITGLTQETHLPLASAARLVGIEFTAMTAAMMLMPLMLGRVGARAIAALAMAGTIGAQAGTLVAGPLLMLPVRALLGFAEGALYGLAVAALGRTARPDRAFGIVVFSNQIVSALLLVLAIRAHAFLPSSGIFLLLVGFLLVTAPCVAVVRADEGAGPERLPIDRGSVVAMLPGLAGIFLFASGFGALWPVVASIAQARGMAETEIGHVLSLAGLAGIAGAAAAIILAERAGRVLPLTLGSLALALALAGTVEGALAIAAPAILFFWSFLVPYYLGSAAVADRGGRLVVLAGSMLPLGIGAGQMFAAGIVNGRNYAPLAVSAAGMVAVAILCMMLLRWQAQAELRLAD